MPGIAVPSILITGGSGHLGRWVVRLAKGKRGHREPATTAVTATYLTHPVREPGIHWRQLDVRDGKAVERLITETRPEVVLHTAAVNPGQGTAFDCVNIVGSGNVARAAALVGARLIHVSSDVIFDGQEGNYVEEDPPSPITPYGRSKALAEEEVRASGAQAVIVRTSLIYGPAVGSDPTPLEDTPWQGWDRQTRWVAGDLKAGKPVRLFTDERRCPIWVKSLAMALLELAQSDQSKRSPSGTLHVAGSQTLSRYQFGVRLAHFHRADPAGIVPALSRESGLIRPLDCTLDCSRARALLQTPLPGVDQVLTRLRSGSTS